VIVPGFSGSPDEGWPSLRDRLELGFAFYCGNARVSVASY